MLRGEGGPDFGCQNVLTLSASIHQPASIATTNINQFSTKPIEKGSNYSYPLIARTHVGSTTKLPQITLIPPLFVYDGFEKDLDAAEVLKRVLDMERDSVGKVLILHIQNFLLSCLSSHNAKNTNPYAYSEIMMQTPSTDTKKWGGNSSQDYLRPSKKLQTRQYHQQLTLYTPWHGSS